MIERTILENLIRNEQYVRKVLPFIKKEYYTDRHEKVLFEEISKFVQRYNNLPTQTSLEIELQNRKDLNGEDYGKIVAILKNFTNVDINKALSFVLKYVDEVVIGAKNYSQIKQNFDIINKNN